MASSYLFGVGVWLRGLKFIADGMLGKLTRWLRMLGHDVLYSQSMSDDQLITLATEEKRVLLTRDQRLFQRAMKQEIDALLLRQIEGTNQLAYLAKHLDITLRIDPNASRCPKCNAQITPVSKNQLIKVIPQTTSSYYHQFWKCTWCGQIYWQGSHWTRIQKTLQDARTILAIE